MIPEVSCARPPWVPAATVEPETARELSEAVAAASADQTPMIVAGRGTKLHWGPPPESAGLVVSTARLDRILEHRAGDLVAVVEPGIRLRDLAEQLAPHGQYWAVDEVVPDSTVGGVMGLALSGPRRHRYGTIRDLVLGMSVVGVDGTLSRSGASVVKNVAGFDVGKLLIGAAGTLGAVASVSLRLHPKPPRERWCDVTSDDVGTLIAAAAGLRHPSLDPLAVELEWDGEYGRLAALFAGNDAEIDQQVELASQRLGHAVRECEARPHPWSRPAEGQVWIKVAVRISGATDVCSHITRMRRDGRVVRLVGSPGVGVYHVTLDAATPEIASATLQTLRSVATDHGGSAVLVAGGDDWCDATRAWGPVGGLSLMRRVKAAFDPDRLFAPGRFVGGI